MAYPWNEPSRPAAPDRDAFAELRRISVELRALRQATGAAARPEARFAGRDGSGTVTVTVDGRQHVRDVALDSRWEQRLPRDGVGDALMRAYGDAVCQMLTASVEAYDQAERETDGALLEQQARADVQGHRRRHVDPEDLLYDVQEQLRQIEMLQRYGDTPAPVVPAARDATVSGPGGFIEITVRGRQISDIRVLLSRLPASSTNGAVAQEAMAAFRAAARAAEARN